MGHPPQKEFSKSKRFFFSKIQNFKRFSFALYSVHSRVDRRNLEPGKLVLRHSVSHFLLNSGGITYWVTELHAALCLNIRANKWNYLIFNFLEWESIPQPAAFTITRLCPCAKIAHLWIIYITRWRYTLQSKIKIEFRNSFISQSFEWQNSATRGTAK